MFAVELITTNITDLHRVVVWITKLRSVTDQEFDLAMNDSKEK